jgi:hypothetical protein
VNTTGVPARFQAALDSLRSTDVRPEVELSEAPSPRRIAPYAVAADGLIPADSPTDDEDWDHGYKPEVRGKFVLLFDPEGQTAWESSFRVVAYVETELAEGESHDPTLKELAWSWVTTALEPYSALALSGTVSVITSRAFGDLNTGATPAKLEIRASWSPTSPEVGPHLQVWAAIMAAGAGLDPHPEKVKLADNVTSLDSRRGHIHHLGAAARRRKST